MKTKRTQQVFMMNQKKKKLLPAKYILVAVSTLLVTLPRAVILSDAIRLSTGMKSAAIRSRFSKYYLKRIFKIKTTGVRYARWCVNTGLMITLRIPSITKPQFD